jgi:5-methylcytosine-specific restriction enzyme A
MKLTVKSSRLKPAGCNSRLSSSRLCKGKAGAWGRGRGGRPWRRLREAVLLRDKYTCQHCGHVGVEGMEVDHIINKASGGTDELSNLQTLCRSCHQLEWQHLFKQQN